MEKKYDECCVEEALNALLVEFFLHCREGKNLTAALGRICKERAIPVDFDLHGDKTRLVEVFLKLKRKEIVTETNVVILKEIANAEEGFYLKKRIKQFEDGKWEPPDGLKTISFSGGEEFRWPESRLDYGSNALSQVLLCLVQGHEHLGDPEREALYIYCEGFLVPSLDFSCYTKDPFQLIEQLMNRQIIGPRNLGLLRRFFSLKPVQQPKAIAILEYFEAGALVKGLLERYPGLPPKSTWQVSDDPICIQWMKLARLIDQVIRMSFKGTQRLQYIQNLLRHVKKFESTSVRSSDRLGELLNRLIEDSHLAEKDKQWQSILRLLVVSGELCCLAESPHVTTFEMSRKIGVSPLGAKILRKMDEFHAFLQEKETILISGEFCSRMEETQELEKAWRKYNQSDEQDGDDDIEMLNSSFKGILLFH